MLALLDRRIALRWITSHHKYHKQMSSLFSGLCEILNEIAGIEMIIEMEKNNSNGVCDVYLQSSYKQTSK